ncbi:hypothetical protein GH714_013711 [Hevea brasiliensis]|uniref:Trichome birefringence-like N-terminal domain-containing protein n=1 Tax=Hevea brasiliensis TaxID=3981 RepID=A0A6A6N4S4_HEVBR|nr:hypothetical protein GH714_013711 [Hevea brasiliensis]
MGKGGFGYDVCTTIGDVSSTITSIIGKIVLPSNILNKNFVPIVVMRISRIHKGVIVTMSNYVKTSSGSENCSLSVSVICDSNGVQGPHSLEKLGTCNYAAVLQHPSGCAVVVSVHGRGWGWFGILVIIILCLFGGYMLVGAVYRYFFLGVRGLDRRSGRSYLLPLGKPQKGVMFSGRWVKDESSTHPLYEESECPYIQPQLTCQEHGRPDKEYQNGDGNPMAVIFQGLISLLS